MKIVLLNTYDQSGGATRACQRLLRGLLAAGADAAMLVREKKTMSSAVISVGSRTDGFLRALLDGILLHWYPHRRLHMFAPAWVPGKAIWKASKIAPDLIHLHWVVNGFVRIEDIPAFNCPVVWTLHDSWPFTGGCHLPMECTRYEQTCGRCPVLGSEQENDWSRHIWKRKNACWKELSLVIVAPSNWMAEKARSSSLFRDRKIVVIPNGIDTSVYCPGSKMEARKKLGLSGGSKLILFGAIHALTDLNKGFDLLQHALQLGADAWLNSQLVFFGEEMGASIPDCGMPVKNFGVVANDEQMVLLYRAADLFVVPSRQETFPYVIMEAMSCGTPCVAFGVAGIPELITHEETGYLAKPFDIEDLLAGIVTVLNDGELQASMAAKSRKWVEDNANLELITQRHLDLYRKLVATS